MGEKRASGGTPFEGETGWRSLVAEDFAVLEEALQLDGGGLGGVGGVDDVGHFVVAEVTTDGAFGGGFGVGGAEEVADMGDDVFSAEGDGDDGCALHEVGDVWEERFVGDVGVVLFEQLVGELHHFAAADAEAFGFKAFEDFAIEAFGDAIGLEEDEGGFLSHGFLGKGVRTMRAEPVESRDSPNPRREMVLLRPCYAPFRGPS